MARKVLFNDNSGIWDTDVNWGLTLTGYELSAPEYKAAFVSVPGRDGDLDLSTALTDGVPRYNNRKLTMTFEISSGTRDTRAALFTTIINRLSGRWFRIKGPDDSTYSTYGRVSVQVNYNDLAHGALTITGNCDPWKFVTTKTLSYFVSSTLSIIMQNGGYRRTVPTVTVSDSTNGITVTYGSYSAVLTNGTYIIPELALPGKGSKTIQLNGTGYITFSWEEYEL